MTIDARWEGAGDSSQRHDEPWYGAASRCDVDASGDGDDRTIDNPDDALVSATERAREAQEDFRETKPEDPAIVPNAHKVVQRAEEVDELAKDAAGEA